MALKEHRHSYHCGTEAAASVVIIVNHIHTLICALCASLQSAAVQGVVHDTRMSQSGPQTKRAHQLGSFFCNTCVASHVYNVTTAENAPIAYHCSFFPGYAPEECLHCTPNLD